MDDRSNRVHARFARPAGLPSAARAVARHAAGAGVSILSCLALLVGMAATQLIGAGAAAADDQVAAAVTAFAGGQKAYVDPSLADSVDAAEVTTLIGNEQILVAVFPSGDPKDLGHLIRQEQPRFTVAVMAGGQFDAGSDVLCPGSAATLASDAAKRHPDDPNATVVDFVTAAAAAPTSACPATTASESGGGGLGVWPWLVGIGLAGLVASGLFVRSYRRKRDQRLETRRAEIVALHDRLLNDLRDVDPRGNAAAEQALTDAAGRHAAAGALIAQAEIGSEYDAAWHTVVEGLTAARTARTLLRLELGEDIPTMPRGEGERLREPSQVRVGEEVYVGYPDYTPGAPNYYEGAAGVPAGWYPVAFWSAPPLGATLSSGFGGFDDDHADAVEQQNPGRPGQGPASGGTQPAGQSGAVGHR